MANRILLFLAVFGSVALLAATNSEAVGLKDIILNEVDPGHVNGTVATYYDALTPEQLTEFVSNYEAGQGFYITPVAAVSWTANGVQYSKTTKIFLVPVGSGQVVVPTAVTCNHSGCTNICAVGGCNHAVLVGKPACSGAYCSGVAGLGCGQQNPTCSKSESASTLELAVFGTP